MRPYNVDIFSPTGAFVTNTNVDDITIAFDYLSGGDNTFNLLNMERASAVKNGGFVHIYRNNDTYTEDYYGYITGTTFDQLNNSYVTIKWCDFMSLLHTDFCMDTDVQHSTTTLENYLKTNIENIFNNVLVVGLSSNVSINYSVTSSTTSWGFNIKSDAEGMHHAILNFYDSILVRALKEYNVVVNVTPSFSDTSITLDVSIGKLEEGSVTIEADISNLIKKNIVVHEATSGLNRLTIYNETNYSQFYTYYLGTDGVVYRVDTDGDDKQQVPVVYDVLSIEPTGDFASSSLAEATSKFSDVKYKDLIELTFASSNDLVSPFELSIARIYHVLSDGVDYETVLTGKEVKSGTIKLVFGTPRYDFTKLLRKGR